ncbi:MAG: ABC transporter permease subunit [Oscillospiraceae bacterium]|nr:ABC transporter permease subunit [Oscillospiraceae bacterium]MCL2278539.1 ABC transporter permease subunit [Oscillospiraceae bacterium]
MTKAKYEPPKRGGLTRLKREIPFHLMILPALVLLIIYSYLPMAGIIMAFQDFRPILSFENSAFVGLDNFRFVFQLPGFHRAFRNTILIASLRIATGIGFPLLLALLINEVRKKWFARSIQTAVFLPFFLSWAVLGGIVREMFSLTGPINQIIEALGGDSIMFMALNNWFRFILVSTHVWQSMGINLIIFLAAITNIDLAQYEASEMDGCNKLKQVWHITLPGMLPIIILVSTLAIGQLLNAGFEQVLILYSPVVYEGGDILDTLVYRMGLIQRQFSPAAAIGLFRSVVSLILVGIAYWSAYKFSDYRIF